MSEHSQVMEQDAVRDAALAYRAVSTGAKQDDVPRGYKWTDLGVIPQEWEVKPLKEVAPLQRGFDLPSSQLEEGPYPVVFSNGIWAYHAKPMVRGPGVVTGRSGTLGHVQFITEDYWPHNTTLWVTNFKNNEPLYIYYLYEKLGFERFQSGSGVPTLNRNDAHSYAVIIAPRKAEQRAIATALSDADALIESLDRLIAKKRAIKHTAMQQLLTGQTRLPGFTGEWETKRLGDISHIKTGDRNNQDKVEDGVYPFFVRSEFVEHINSYAYECEAIVVPGEGRIGEIFHYVNGRFDVHQRVYAITQFRSDVSAKFVYYYMALHFGDWAMRNTVKATVDSLRLPTFQTFELQLPPTEDEQAAIATVLSDVEAEIEALERRCDKARQIKQGMMQELLTGRVRLMDAMPEEYVDG